MCDWLHGDSARDHSYMANSVANTLHILKGSTRPLKSTRQSMASGAWLTINLLKGCNGGVAERLDAAAQVQGFQLCVPTQAAQC